MQVAETFTSEFSAAMMELGEENMDETDKKILAEV